MKQSDLVAREAARLLETGQAESIRQAIAQAAEQLKATDAPPPTHLQVRRHAQAMAMQALGDAGYQDRITKLWQWAEELMTTLEFGLESTDTLLVGRAAKGQLDAGVVIHIRANTDESKEAMRDMLVEYGYAEPTFETVDTKYGRMNRLLINDEEGYQAVVLRVKPSIGVDRKTCVFTGKPIATVTLEELRKMIAEKEARDSSSD